MNATSRLNGYYGTAKAFGEALGSYYWDDHYLSSLHLHIGWVLVTDDPMCSALALTLWLSHRDVAQVVRRCLEAPASLGYDVFYATSVNPWEIWSIARAQQRLGYRPEDRAGDTLTPGPRRTAGAVRMARRMKRTSRRQCTTSASGAWIICALLGKSDRVHLPACAAALCGAAA